VQYSLWNVVSNTLPVGDLVTVPSQDHPPATYWVQRTTV